MFFYGEGWAKSTAAYGYALRAVGRGWPASVIQFVKGAGWNTAEALSATSVGIEWHTFTRGLTWGARDPFFLSAEALEVSRRKLSSTGQGLVVLDEITNAITNGWVSEASVLEVVEGRAPGVNVILTGKYPNDALHDVADVVTRFEKEKDSGTYGILGNL